MSSRTVIWRLDTQALIEAWRAMRRERAAWQLTRVVAEQVLSVTTWSHVPAQAQVVTDSSPLSEWSIEWWWDVGVFSTDAHIAEIAVALAKNSGVSLTSPGIVSTAAHPDDTGVLVASIEAAIGRDQVWEEPEGSDFLREGPGVGAPEWEGKWLTVDIDLTALPPVSMPEESDAIRRFMDIIKRNASPESPEPLVVQALDPETLVGYSLRDKNTKEKPTRVTFLFENGEELELLYDRLSRDVDTENGNIPLLRFLDRNRTPYVTNGWEDSGGNLVLVRGERQDDRRDPASGRRIAITSYSQRYTVRIKK